MHEILLFSPWLSAAALAWILAQVLKMIFHLLVTHELDFSRLADTGGMPSSHTAFVSGLCTMTGLSEGWNSVAFALALCFSMIIVYDATNLRRSAGYHAQVLNEIVPKLLSGSVLKEVVTYRRLRELLGHNPTEVFVGAILGVMVSTWFNAVMGL